MMITFSAIKTIRMLALVGLLSGCAPRQQIRAVAPSELQAQIQASESPLLLVHAWATWCVPCREEFPELVKVYHRFNDQGVKLLLVSADDPSELESVDQFLAEYHFPGGSLISTELNEAFIEALSPDWSGSLPATFFYADGKLLREWAGKRSYEQYAETISALLEKRAHPID